LIAVSAVLCQVPYGFFQSFLGRCSNGSNSTLTLAAAAAASSHVLQLPITVNKTAPDDSTFADYLKCPKHTVKESKIVLNYDVHQQFDRFKFLKYFVYLSVSVAAQPLWTLVPFSVS
jgi:hypothetical protein